MYGWQTRLCIVMQLSQFPRTTYQTNVVSSGPMEMSWSTGWAHTHWTRFFLPFAGSKRSLEPFMCVFLNWCSYVQLTNCAQHILIIRFGHEANALEFSLVDYKQILTGKYAGLERKHQIMPSLAQTIAWTWMWPCSQQYPRISRASRNEGSLVFFSRTPLENREWTSAGSSLDSDIQADLVESIRFAWHAG